MSGDPGGRRAAFQEAMRQAAGDFSPRGLEYIHYLVLQLASRGAPPAPPAGTSPGPEKAAPSPGRYRALPAGELCRRFRDRAASDFGALAPHVVRRWGLATGRDLGRAVFLLAEKKCLSLETGETLDAYAAAGEFLFA